MGKKDGKKKPKSPQRSGEDAPSPAHHASEVVTELHRTPAMVADSDAEIARGCSAVVRVRAIWTMSS